MDTPAIRTVSETDDTHTIELRLAYGGPVNNGRDTYRTFFTPKTDWALGLHPEGLPILMSHGFDDEFGLDPIGRTSPTETFRSDRDGLWVQAQLDKRHRHYANRIRPLLDKGALGASQGSAEHSVRIDPKSGEVQLWPLQEISLTPTEANPWNVVAARSAETARLLIVGTRVDNDPNVGGGVDRDKLPDEDFAGPDRSFPIVKPGDVSDAASSLGRAKGDTAPIKAKIIAIAKAKGPEFEAELPKAWTDDSARSGELPEDEPETPAVRASKRNSAADQALIDQIHDRTVQLGATAHAEDADAQANDDSPPAEADDDAARSGETVPRILVIREPVDPAAVRAHVDEAVTAIAREAALGVASSFVRRPSTP